MHSMHQEPLQDVVCGVCVSDVRFVWTSPLFMVDSETI